MFTENAFNHCIVMYTVGKELGSCLAKSPQLS